MESNRRELSDSPSPISGSWLDSIKTGFTYIYKGRSRPSTTTNSLVMSIPAINDVERFFPGRSCNIASSLVEIRGPTDEPLHFHSSHLIGLVVSGEGFCRYIQPGESVEHREQVLPGDIVLLAQEAMHIFECEPGKTMTYVALEFSDREIDYQKHFHDQESV